MISHYHVRYTEYTVHNPEPDDFSLSCQVYGVYTVHNPEPDDFSLSCQVYGEYTVHNPEHDDFSLSCQVYGVNTVNNSEPGEIVPFSNNNLADISCSEFRLNRKKLVFETRIILRILVYKY